jgi:hypothetical protein
MARRYVGVAVAVGSVIAAGFATYEMAAAPPGEDTPVHRSAGP